MEDLNVLEDDRDMATRRIVIIDDHPLFRDALKGAKNKKKERKKN